MDANLGHQRSADQQFHTFSPAVPYFYYPELNDGKYHVFRVKYGKTNGNEVEWTQVSDETRFLHAEPS